MSAQLFCKESYITKWLEYVPFTFNGETTSKPNDYAHDPPLQSQESSKKRKHQPNHRLLSPPASIANKRTYSEDMAPPRTPKKRKTDTTNDADGNEETPRPQIPPLSGSDARSLSSTSASQRSSQSSPTKLFPQLSINPAGLDRTPMDLRDPNMPQELADLIVEMQSIGMGQGVVPISLKVRFEGLL